MPPRPGPISAALPTATITTRPPGADLDTGGSAGMARCRTALVGIVALVAAACSAAPEAQPPPPEPHEITAALTEAMTVLEPDQVTMLRTGDRRRRIEYRRGAFASASAEHCSYEMNPCRALDDDAAADIDRIAAALDVGRTDFAGVDRVIYSSDGAVMQAEFHYYYLFGSEVFIYEPGYHLPPDEPGRERVYTAIDQNWYLATVDWL